MSATSTTEPTPVPDGRVEAYPNPSEDNITVHNIKGSFEYKMVSIIGNTVPFSLVKSGDTYTGSVENLAPGCYILIVKQTSGSHALKIIRK